MVTQRVAAAASRLLARRIDRRGVLTRAAVVGSAVATSGLDYVLKPGTAYASVCGSGNTCSSGWTAMCCTINNGVNQCPPGSFAGGWWKADGASLCGGHARYYIDCQAECTKCGCGGGAFCSHRCWNCHSHCADGPCDKRHVCRNVFRYGQCERDRHCSGPVLCRAITCTPPWKWADCSTASATDNYTRSHSATCLPRWSHITHHYKALGSEGSALGATVHAEYSEHHARVQRYQHGRMYWTKHTGAHYLVGDLSRVYIHLHEMRSPLGLPLADPVIVAGGRAVRCEKGGIWQKHDHEAHALWGAILDAWQASGGLSGSLGWPTTSRREADDGSYALLEHGGVYNGPSTPVCVLTDPVDQVYGVLDRFDGHLGWPLTSVTPLADGVGFRAGFEHGEIIQHPTYGTHGLFGPVDAAFRRLGGQAGVLGYPTTDVTPVTAADGTVGTVLLTVTGAIGYAFPGTTAYGVWDHVFSAWIGDGGVGGELGFPVADMTVDSNGDEHGVFAHGRIDYAAATGRVSITPTPA